MFESFTCKDKPYQPQNLDFQKPTFGALRRSLEADWFEKYFGFFLTKH